MRQNSLGNVLAWLFDARDRARVVDALRNIAIVGFVASSDELITRLKSSVAAPSVVIVPTSDRDGRGTDSVVKRLVHDWPATAVMAWCPVAAHRTADFRALTAAGVHQIVLVGVHDDGAVLRGMVFRAWHTNAAERVMRRLAPLLPAPLHPMVEIILQEPDRISTIGSLADALGVHRRTLVNRCERAGKLQPTDVLGWARLALVAYHLENTGCTIETIAMDMSYPSSTTLRNTIKRYTGMRASDLREQGALHSLLGALSDRLSA
jgi:AraC-like DNA-binding protein